MTEPAAAGSGGCPECGKRFDNPEDLSRHRERHRKRDRRTTHPREPLSPLSILGIVLLVIVALLIIGFGTCVAILSAAY